MWEKTRKLLSMMLAVAMCVTMLPTSALAVEGEGTQLEIAEDANANADVTIESATSENKTIENKDILDEPVVETASEDVLDEESSTVFTTASNAAKASFDVDDLTVSSWPSGGTTSTQPFPSGIAGSENLRIPGIVALNDDTLVASADLRWDNEKDGGGSDLIVTRSTDGGKTWNYTIPGYLGDNGDVWNSNSSTLMDPVIITDGDTLYLLADMFPAGYSISSSSTANVFSDTGIGFNDEGYLLLSDDGRYSYGYYLYDGTIYATDGTAVEGCYVDGWFNLYESDDTYVTNLFFSNSPYQVRATTYYCMMTSTNGGKTWSDPELLNIKPEGVSWMVLGPGSGLVTSDGTIAFTAYDGSNIYLIYSTNGNTWKTVKTSAAGNESSIVELDDGTIRAFVKRGGSNTIAYVDFTKSSTKYYAGNLVDTGVANFSNCMVSSLHYSEYVDGKEAVLVCCPSNSAGGTWGGRFNGKIYVFTLDDSNAMTLAYSYQVNESFFAYSNMAELSDGSIALLYEDDCISYSAGGYYGDYSHITFTTLDMDTIAPSAVIGGSDTVTVTSEKGTVTATTEDGTVLSDMNFSTKLVNVSDSGVPVAIYTIELTDAFGKAYTGGATVKIPFDEEVFGSYTEFVGYVDDDTESFPVTLSKDGKYLICEVPHFSDIRIEPLADEPENNVAVNLNIGGTHTATLSGEVGTAGTYDVTVDSIKVAQYTITHNAATNGTATYTEKTDPSGTAQKIGISPNTWLKLNNDTTLTTTSNYADATEWTITAVSGGYTISSGSYVLGLSRVDSWKGYSYTLTNSTTNSVWSYSKTEGFYQYLQQNRWWSDNYYMNGTSVSRNSTGNKLYDVTYSGGSEATTTVEFTGVYPTDKAAVVTVGANNTYNVTVNYLTKNVNVLIGGTSTDTQTTAVQGSISNSNSNVVTATASGSTVTFTGVAAGTANVTAGTTKYTVTVTEAPVTGELFENIIGTATYQGDGNNMLDLTGKPITKLTTTVGSSFQLGVDATAYDSIVWESADASIASVDSIGKVTGVSVDTTTVTATVSKDGVIDTKTIEVQVLPSLGTVTSSNKTTVCYYVEEVTHTTPYYTLYSTNYAKELVAAQEGEVIYFERPANIPFGMIWTAAPESGYALTYMAATNSEGQYYPLHTGNRVLVTNDSVYYASSTACSNIYNYYGGNQTTINNMLTRAVEALLCDGAMSMGRKANDVSPNLGSSLSFRSAKLPTVDKKVVSVNDEDYVPGIIAMAGDVIVFEVTVTQYAAQDAVTYTNDVLTEKLSGARFGSTSGSTTKSDFLSDTALSSDSEYTYMVYYTVKESDLDTTITNTVDFDYTYQSAYSTASMDSNAEAKAAITASTYKPKHLVIDFCLPVTVHLEPWGAPVALRTGDNAGSATYGDVAVSGNTTNGWDVTYTPTSVLKGDDLVHIYSADGADYTFTVTPASNVLYEEGFMSGWSGTVSKLNGTGNKQIVGNIAPYGYDSAYADLAGVRSGSVYSATVGSSNSMTGYLTTEFNGNGFDLIGTCSPTSAYIFMTITGKNYGDTRVFIIDPSHSQKTLYQVPLAHVGGLTDDDYTVKLFGAYRNSVNLLEYATDAGVQFVTVISVNDGTSEVVPVGNLNEYTNHKFATAYKGTNIEIDGFRVYRSSVHNYYDAYDTTTNPHGAVDANGDAYSGEMNAIYTNVMDLVGSGYTAYFSTNTNDAYVDGSTTSYTIENYEGMGGPQNEVYLNPGDSLVIGIANGTKTQVSLRSLEGATINAKLNSATVALKHTTEMYYVVDPASGLVTITNPTSSTGILAVGNIKTQVAMTGFRMLRSVDYANAIDVIESETVFEPEVLSAQTSSRMLGRKKITTLIVKSSLDVATLEVNGKVVKPVNSRLVKWGMASEYLYTVSVTSNKGQSTSFEIVAYDADGLASETYIVE